MMTINAARADAPASRMGSQWSFTLDEPPLTTMPGISRTTFAEKHLVITVDTDVKEKPQVKVGVYTYTTQRRVDPGGPVDEPKARLVE